MKTLRITAFIIALCSVLSGPAFAGAENQADKTLSPYFFVKSENPDLDELPLKSTKADRKSVV